jgi:hypothetical protein
MLRTSFRRSKRLTYITYILGSFLVYESYKAHNLATKKGYNMTKHKQKQAIKFFLKYADKWHSYANDYETVNIISSLVNLKILNHNEFKQVKINTHNANLYLNQG